jgi:hypothetical protein
MIQARDLNELRDNARVYFPQSFDLLPKVKSSVQIRYGNGRIATARVASITDGGDTMELIVDGRDWFLHKDRETDYWIVA